MDRTEWIATYEPLIDRSGNLISYDVVEDLEFIKSQNENLVWTEMWDFDSEQPYLFGGCILDEDGGITWYLCKKPWSESNVNIVEWTED